MTQGLRNERPSADSRGWFHIPDKTRAILAWLGVAVLLVHLSSPDLRALDQDTLNPDWIAAQSMLSYQFDLEQEHTEGVDREAVLRPLCVLSTGREGGTPAKILVAVNPYGAPEDASVITYMEFPQQPILHMRLPFPVCDMYRYDDLETGLPEAAVSMFGRDTVWLVRLLPSEGRFESIPVCAMEPKSNSTERTRSLILAAEDYDFDHHTEVFLYVYSPRPQDTRGIFCIEIETGRIEWKLPVAGPVVWNDLYCLPDSTDPRVIFITEEQLLGNRDQFFDDRIGQLAIADSRGQLKLRRTVVRDYGSPLLRRAEVAGQFYLAHNTFDTLADSLPPSSHQWRLSKIDATGNVLHSHDCSSAFTDLWTFPHYRDRRPAVWFELTNDETLYVLDSTLELLAKEDGSEIGGFIAAVPLSPFEDTMLVFSSGVFTRDLQQKAILPFYSDHLEPLLLNQDGFVAHLAMLRPNAYVVGQYYHRRFIDILSVLYMRHQTPVLMTITGLVVALILVNFFRYRNKSTARLIARQKEELEETHRQLKAAQATIVAQEKYRQARDIAGGFAHEIRNALFPAEAALHKMATRRTSSAEDDETSRKYVGTARSAVARAIGVTELISSYTRLESEAVEEQIDLAAIIAEVIEANRLRAQDQGVTLEAPPQTGLWIRSNAKQLFMVINNLVVNSLDALTDRPTPRIILTVGREADNLLLSVTDNGIGISEADRPRVFDTFFSTKPNKGNGLGLAIAKRIIELYGGSIAVASEPGAWTRFDLRFRAGVPPA